MTYQESKLLRLFQTADDRAREDVIRILERHQVPEQVFGKVISIKTALTDDGSGELRSEKPKDFSVQ